MGHFSEAMGILFGRDPATARRLARDGHAVAEFQWAARLCKGVAFGVARDEREAAAWMQRGRGVDAAGCGAGL